MILGWFQGGPKDPKPGVLSPQRRHTVPGTTRLVPVGAPTRTRSAANPATVSSVGTHRVRNRQQSFARSRSAPAEFLYKNPQPFSESVTLQSRICGPKPPFGRALQTAKPGLQCDGF
jgi:hypothetical protein